MTEHLNIKLSYLLFGRMIWLRTALFVSALNQLALHQTIGRWVEPLLGELYDLSIT